MATPVNPVTQITAWTYPFTTDAYFTDTNPLSDPDTYAFRTGTSFQPVYTGTQQMMAITPGVESNNLLLKFIGTPPTAGTIKEGVGAIWGVSELVSGGTTEHVAEFLGRFDLTVGTVPATGSGILPDGDPDDLAYFCNRIDPRVDASLFPGMRVVGQEQDASPVLVIDSMGYVQFLVELKCRLPEGSGNVAAEGLALIYRMI